MIIVPNFSSSSVILFIAYTYLPTYIAFMHNCSIFYEEADLSDVEEEPDITAEEF